ncbi:DUF4466 domain-containing protein [Rudanella paleaurantiibacter]|uniref:DUF4466 domain-containing protein n=1 Tax=Rudanella paleaurantiibacter TaxID=2614655 RepID=A0A7J5U6A0_9BACT|nr:DUF4466 family protein [Rudanella paleaurantiibacter]KAB7733181.1 DUF4466 domain-containing protein [Rudanella paleaurantiibacter]
MKTIGYAIGAVVGSLLLITGCQSDKVTPEGPLRNDLLKKTTGPAVVGDRIEFAYALGTVEGNLQNVRAEATIAGGAGTGFSRFSWFTNRNTGVDQPVQTATDTVTNGALSTARIIDSPTSNKAVTLRYFYYPTADAKGKDVSFRFSGTSSTGQEVSFQSPTYRISNMDMRRSLVLADGAKAYVSIADMAVYTKAEVEQNNLANKIDFVYIYRPTLGTGNFAFGHAIVAPSNPEYLKDVTLPTGLARTRTAIDKRVDVKDAQLRGTSGFDLYIDDIDLQQTTFPSAADYAFGFAADQGAFVKTADGAYNAYVYVNAVNNTARTMTISIKRLKVN